MTFVAVLHSTDYPLIVADSMISRPGQYTGGMASPLLDSPDARLGHDFAPVGLSRKFWMLPDKSIYLYSGVVAQAQKLFDYLHNYLTTNALTYDHKVHLLAKNFRANCANKDFSFVVITKIETPTKLRYDVHFDGNVLSEFTQNNGYVLALGSGAEKGIEIIKRAPGLTPRTFEARIVNAFNLAALLTLDYQDGWGKGSDMSQASSGGYFEVVVPTHFAHKYQSLHRGVAHIFISIDKKIKVVTFIAGKQLDESTEIIVAHDMNTKLIDWEGDLDGARLLQYSIQNNNNYSITVKAYDGNLRVNHIPYLVVYVDGLPDCGRSEHSFRRHTIIVRPDLNPLVMMLEDDDDVAVDPVTGMRIGPGNVKVCIIPPDLLWKFVDSLQLERSCRKCAPQIAATPESN